jgi:enoyl-CoA hydratase/carnithine racemase
VAARGTGKVGLPEVSLGVLPGTGGTQRLARLVGKAQAMQLMVEGTLVDYDRALELGLVHHVWDANGFLDRARDYARSFCPPNRASLAVGHIKRAVQTGLEVGIEQGLALERELQQRLFASADAAEGIRAYVDKRKSKFEGR